MKQFLKSLIVIVLAWQVRRLYRRASFKTIAIAGSYGKTSTKLATAQLIGSKFKTQYQFGNYNDLVSVPLVFFGLSMPSLFNPFAWLKTFFVIEKKLRKPYTYDVVVVELGIDGPGQMRQFDKYIQVDLALIVSIGPEHMEYFADVKDVAREEFDIIRFSSNVLYNSELVDTTLVAESSKILPYAIERDESGQTIVSWGDTRIELTGFEPSSKAQEYSVASAAVVASHLGISARDTVVSVADLSAMPGRMNILEGINQTTIIDDTYNASPEATLLALEALKSRPEEQKIALLGNMNELGKNSAQYHREIGEACSPEYLDLVVTIGPDANSALSDAARKNGCSVVCADTPQQAAEVIRKQVRKGAVILAKGSQNGVFAEEAVKELLDNQSDEKYLVRQTPQWLAKKSRSFKS